MGPKGDVPLYALGCPWSGSGPAAFHTSVPRVLARFLGLKGGVPLYGYSTCEFPRIGRYLIRFLGMTAEDIPVYALGCCPEGSSVIGREFRLQRVVRRERIVRGKFWLQRVIRRKRFFR